MINFTKFIGFYSYKGGVGRSLALANTAYEMAKRGEKVLIIDMDLEAPGQHMTELFLKPTATRYELSEYGSKGLVECFTAWQNHRILETVTPFDLPSILNNCFLHARQEVYENNRDESVANIESAYKFKGEIHLLPAGNVSSVQYANDLHNIKWDELIEYGESFFSQLKQYLIEKGYTRILLDTRTGLSKEFIACAFDLADTMVFVTSYNRQNIEGTRDMVQRLDKFNQSLTQEDKLIHQKRYLLIGSPEPTTLGFEQRNRRLADIKLQWPELVNFSVQLPYDAELALEEKIKSWEQDKSQVNIEYAQKIKELVDILEKNELNNSLSAASIQRPTNPFGALRGGFMDSNDVVRYFVDPGGTILQDMQGFTPLVITGARGTGKTMLARYFGFEEWMARQKAHSTTFDLSKLEQIGLYFHIDSDILHSFNISNDDAQRQTHNQLFTFFFDLIVLRKALVVLQELGGLAFWLDENKLMKSLYAELGKTSSADANCQKFLDLIEECLTSIRLYLNNPTRFLPPLVAAPNILIKRLAEHLRKYGKFDKRYFVIHIDEYENFPHYQQCVINTRLKHTRLEEGFTFRFYMRSGGFHTRDTISGQPIDNKHDFREHSLDEDLDFIVFKSQALSVAKRHLELSPWFAQRGYTDLEGLLESISDEVEAQKLYSGKRKQVLEKWLDDKQPQSSDAMKAWFLLEPSYLCRAVGVVLLNQGKSADIITTAFANNTNVAKDWRNNYSRGTLFWLHSLHRTSKRYAGVNNLIGLSGNNIRVFLDYCYAIFAEWLKLWENNHTPMLPINLESQDDAVHLQARLLRENLYAAGNSPVEVNLFLERFGRLCEALHKSPLQSEPEINHFAIREGTAEEPFKTYLRHAWFEGIVRKLPANKQKSLTEMRGEDWQLAPWLCPLFNLSSRRKKKLTLSANEVEVLFSNDKLKLDALIRNKLKEIPSQNNSDELPQQDGLFE
jgi:MinD-like ATPase involved in chromosome partitioning or flagellar assembly